MGYFGKHLFEVKTAVVTFWAKFEQIGLLFIPTTGHTAFSSQNISRIIEEPVLQEIPFVFLPRGPIP